MQTDRKEKKYLNGMIIKEKSFDNGGTQLRLSVKVSEFIEDLRSIQDNGWANIIVARRKDPSDKGVTHYAYEDTWKPGNNYNDTNDPQYDTPNNDKEDLPF